MKLRLLLCLTIFLAFNTQAAEENYESYDTIINELSSRQSSLLSSYSKNEVHMGIGYVNSTSKISGTNIPIDRMTLQGIQAQMGIDLFPRFSSLVQISYLTPSTKSGTEMEAVEFDLIALFKPSINRLVDGRFGGGLGVRNVDIKAPQTQTDFTNPLAIVVAGIEAKITNQVGFVTELSFKNALTGSNAEKYVVDLGVRIDGHF